MTILLTAVEKPYYYSVILPVYETTITILKAL